MAYGTIDIGSAVDGTTVGYTAGKTTVELTNPANASGILDSFTIRGDKSQPVSGMKVGTAYVNSGDATKYTTRDYESISGTISGVQTYTGKNCDVVAGDYITHYFSGGQTTVRWAVGDAYLNIYRKAGDQWGTGEQTYTYDSGSGKHCNYILASGFTVPDAPTDVVATENNYDKVSITWTAGTGETLGHRVYRDGVDISGLIATNDYYDDNAATPGQTYSYTVKATNLAGLSSASTADNGKRLFKTRIIYI